MSKTREFFDKIKAAERTRKQPISCLEAAFTPAMELQGSESPHPPLRIADPERPKLSKYRESFERVT